VKGFLRRFGRRDRFPRGLLSKDDFGENLFASKRDSRRGAETGIGAQLNCISVQPPALLDIPGPEGS